MKRTAFIPVLLALMLSGCGSGEDMALLTELTETVSFMTETDGKTGERSETASEKSETSEKASETAETNLETENEKSYSVKTETSVSAEKTEYINLPPVTEHTAPEISFSFDFDSMETLTDEQITELAQLDLRAEDIIEDYTVIDDMGVPFAGSFDIMFVPEGVDFEAYCSDENNYPMSYDEYENGVIEKLGENDIYSEWSNTYTEIRTLYENDVLTKMYIDRAYRRVFMKNFTERDGARFYTGEMTLERVKENFDILSEKEYGSKLCRKVTETDDSFVYKYYNICIVGGDWGLNDTAVLGRYSYTVSKSDGSFNSEPYLEWETSAEIFGSAVYLNIE